MGAAYATSPSTLGWILGATVRNHDTISDEPAQMQPRSKTPAEKTESSGCTWLLNPAGLSLPVYSQPATSLLVKAADPQTETEGLRPGFSPTHHPYIFVDCIKIQLEKQWDNCNCILIQR